MVNSFHTALTRPGPSVVKWESAWRACGLRADADLPQAHPDSPRAGRVRRLPEAWQGATWERVVLSAARQ
jgi:hypothetical protein